MYCSKVGCAEMVKHHPKGLGFVCPKHGLVHGIKPESLDHLKRHQERFAKV